LGLEAGDYLTTIHSRLDDLERHAPFDRFLLLGHIDHSESTFADLLQELVRSNSPAPAIRRILDINARHMLRNRSGLFMSLQQSVESRAQRAIFAASVGK